MSSAPDHDGEPHGAAHDAIEAVVRDYIDGWYAGDVDRMDRSLHPELVKRTSADANADVLRVVSRERMLELTANGGGEAPGTAVEIAVDAALADIAAARVVSPDNVDYLHLVRTSGGWRIAHVLFVNRG